ncbi:alpha/beta-hydrolase, partial [Lentithecium fluviatile CBS 122367]
TTLTTNYIERPTERISQKSVQALSQGAAFCDRISSKLDAVLTSIDDGMFSGQEQDLLVPEDQASPPLQPEYSQQRSVNAVYPSNAKSSNVFSKVWLYSNSRLPPHLPPFKVYMPTFPLICLAASYSERAYEMPAGPKISPLETHIPADWRSGTKAMVLKSLPIDDMNTIVFAIRGSQTFMDWAVNYRCEPSSPEGFLDDAGNACHAGFLYVAKKMVKPVAERLRVLLQENPARSNASLLITGHSAGGAVAALLYSHMMNTELQSELSYLTGFFKRVHCITFGAPPISLLPLQKPNDQRHKKSIFFSFINEGDPVPRADRPVVKSLLKLYSSPAPSISSMSNLSNNFSKLNVSATSQPTSTKQLRKFAKPKPSKSSLQTVSTLVSTTSRAPSWPIPTCALSPAGRLIILRPKGGRASHMPGFSDEDIEAVTVDDQMLRNVVYGDPVKHMMRVYKKRVESLATKAVTGN